VRRGARRLESSGTLNGVDHVGFENPDGQKVLVVTNSGPAKKVIFNQADRMVELALAKDSVSTLTWS
jgi:O-glycosyl hydrolase